MKLSQNIQWTSALLLTLIAGLFGYSQNTSNSIETSYEAYNETAQEVVYVHLNKSTYLKGEDIGFKAYVFDKKDKKPSRATTNLYISIENEDQEPVIQKLLRVMDGVTSTAIEIDSSFSSGTYYFKAYTNWMRNFDENNIFAEAIEIIDPELNEFIEEELVDARIDAQFLPEGGHLVDGVASKVGVVIKDPKGFGVPNATGSVFNSKDELVTSFKVNPLGIGNFLLIPSIEERYTIKVESFNDTYTYPLDTPVESIGVGLSVTSNKDKVIATVATNNRTMEFLKGKPYTLAIHNGDKMQTIDFSFDDKQSISKSFDTNELPGGVTIFTIFNEQGRPVSERIFFNYKNLNMAKAINLATEREKDSTKISLSYSSIEPSEYNQLSVSVLPAETETYNRHQTIISAAYLKPYLNGYVEQAGYYFTDIDGRKKADLDDLLITQGWSSFNWRDIFKSEDMYLYPFEQGINVTANINAKKSDRPTYLLHNVGEQEPRLFDVGTNQKAFTAENIFPIGSNKVYFSEVTDLGNRPSSLYFQVSPTRIPEYELELPVLNPKPLYNIKEELKDNAVSFENIENTQQLEAVYITGKIDRNRTRTQRLNTFRYGRVKVIDDNATVAFNTLGEYLRYYGFYVDESNGGFSVNSGYFYGLRGNTSANVSTVGGGGNLNAGTGDTGGGSEEDTPTLTRVNTNPKVTIFFDDFPMVDTSFLHQYPLIYIDYIEINRRGFGEGVRGSSGVIKVYSKNTSSIVRLKDNSVQELKLPLSFAANKEFYVPKYQNIRDDFYRKYGVVDWKPNVAFNNNEVNFKIKKQKVPLKLFVEGILNDGTFISEILEVEAN
jgi:hypothetical protein